MNNPTLDRKKLIEVDLPLDDINRESAREKSIRHGHPSTLHLWWARRPLAACRAVIFASMVDDPSTYLDEPEAQRERERLHNLIKDFVKWENTNNETLLAKARYEIARSVARSHGETAPTKAEEVLHYLAEKVPTIYDPFCGGGSIPLEAQRLGLRARGSDLNPVAVLINKAMIELPHPFRNEPPINPGNDSLDGWRGAAGLANDIRYYGRWMREEAYKRIGHLYPKAKLPDGTEATVIAWLWARTVPCANPACRIPMPLVKTFQLSKKKGNEHWTRPVVDKASKTISFIVQNHSAGVPNKETVSRTRAYCVSCGGTVKLSYVREQAKAGNMREIMTGIVAEGKYGRLFLSPTEMHIDTALSAQPAWRPRGTLPEQSSALGVQSYGVTHWHQLFTTRQLTTLTTFSDLLPEVHNRMIQDGATDAYANSVCTYLTFAMGRTADGGCKGATWQRDTIAHVFAIQGIGMIWNFAEANPFSSSTQNWIGQVEWIAKVVECLPTDANIGEVYQADAAITPHVINSPVIIMDPPYYDNIGFADLADFFYVWLREPLRGIYPELFAGISTPKAEEMIANRHRFENSRERFEELLSKTLQRIRERCADQYPSAIFYAYKQQKEEQEGRASTGWETMLSAVISAGFQIVGTWPMSTERTARLIALKANALASSVVLVCRPRLDTAQNISLGGFLTALRNEMPAALDRLTRGAHIAPVDLAQAAIGPGMQVYSRYKSVRTTRDGELVTVSVREALVAINNEIDRYHEEQEGDFDAYTRFCLAWFKQHGFAAGEFGTAEVLARANDVAIAPMSGRVLTAERGKVQLLPPAAYDANHPNAGLSLLQITTWEACHLMVYHLNPKNEDGQDVPGAADVGRAMQNNATSNSVVSVERLARILYSHYDRQGNAANAVLFNNLVTSWESIERNMREDQQLEF